MSRLFYHVMQDNAGNLLFDVSGTMRLAGSGTLATIYGDEALTVILPNPMTNHPSYGSFKCFLGAGDYDFYMAKAGYTFETLTGVQGHGTMAQQDASAVAITGGSATFTGNLQANQGMAVPNYAGDNATGLYSLVEAAGGTNRWNLYCLGTAPNYLAGPVQFGDPGTTRTNLGLGTMAQQDASAVAITGGSAALGGLDVTGTVRIVTKLTLGTTPFGYATKQEVLYDKTSQWGAAFLPGSDSGSFGALAFLNAAGSTVGSIVTTGSGTAYNTTSDARLKYADEQLTGALDVVRALRPITHLWRADDSRGYGFLASEVEETLPPDAGVITGARDAVDDQGNIVPQMIDMGKLVPFLVGAVQTLAAQVETLSERVTELEHSLGP